jgi:hypothetical protein
VSVEFELFVLFVLFELLVLFVLVLVLLLVLFVVEFESAVLLKTIVNGLNTEILQVIAVEFTNVVSIPFVVQLAYNLYIHIVLFVPYTSSTLNVY